MTPSHTDNGGVALQRCVACSSATFAERHWGHAPLLSRAAELGVGFGDLFDAVAVDELVSRRGLRTPFLRMAKDGSVLAPGRFTRGGGAGASINDQAADDRILGNLADGATLVLQALHRTWPPLVGFAARLAAELGHPVQINAYVTPPQNQGFAPHYDVHDVFVLQIAGRKRWQLHAPVVVDPLDDDAWERHRVAVAARAGEAPVLDTELAPGDALYLPRGTIHSAQALGETSIHLTVGVHPLTRFHLVRHLLDTAQADAGLRTSLPMGVDLTDARALQEHLAATVETLQAFLARADAAAAGDALADVLMRQTRPEPLAPLAQLRAAGELTADTTLRLRVGLRAALHDDGDEVRLATLDRTLSLPVATADALKQVLAGDQFVPAGLPGLDVDAQLVLARRLLREGVVVPAESPR